MMKTSTPYPSKTKTAMATAKKAYLNAPHDVDIESDQPATRHEFLSEEPMMPAPNVVSNNKTERNSLMGRPLPSSFSWRKTQIQVLHKKMDSGRTMVLVFKSRSWPF
jgi:hypothetical protein